MPHSIRVSQEVDVNFRSQTIDLGPLTLHIRTAGDPSNPTLLLLHGLGSTSHIWDLLAPHLVERFRLVAPDQRGHGRSGKPASGYGWEEVCSDAVRLLDHLGVPSAHVMGHSWGGDVALELATRHPDRVAALGLIDGGIIDFQAHLSWPEAARLLEPMDVWGMTLPELEHAIDGWLTSLPSPEQRQIILANYERRADGTVAPWLARDANMEIARALWEHRPPQLYPSVRAPTLMVHALPPEPRSPEDERFVSWRSDCATAAERGIARVAVVRYRDTVHDVPLQRPQQLAADWQALLTTFAVT